MTATALIASAILLACIVLSCTPATAQIEPATIIQRLGYPAGSRLLIIHSDDFGMSRSVNRATIEALNKGWITSASIMVPCPSFSEAADYASKHPEADIGLHLTLTSEWDSYRWGPVSSKAVPSLLDKQGYLPHTAHALASQANPEDVREELRAQIEKARAHGINFTHLDSHMGTLFKNPVLYDVYQQVAHEYHVPNLMAEAGSPHGKIRGRHGLELAMDTIVVSKDLQMNPLHERKHWLQVYEHMLSPLPPNGVYELIVHLGFDDPELEGITGRHFWGAKWRQADYDLVSNPEFQRFLRDQKFVLVTWKDLARAMAPSEVAKTPAETAKK